MSYLKLCNCFQEKKKQILASNNLICYKTNQPTNQIYLKKKEEPNKYNSTWNTYLWFTYKKYAINEIFGKKAHVLLLFPFLCGFLFFES